MHQSSSSSDSDPEKEEESSSAPHPLPRGRMQFSIDSYSSRDQREVPYRKKLSRSESATDAPDYRLEVGPDGRMSAVPEDPPPRSPTPPPIEEMDAREAAAVRSRVQSERRPSLVAEVPAGIALALGDREKLDRKREYREEPVIPKVRRGAGIDPSSRHSMAISAVERRSIFGRFYASTLL